MIRIKTLSYVTLTVLTGAMLSACGGGSGASSDNNVIPASALVNENIPMTTETVMGRTSTFSATITASAQAQNQLNAVGNDQLHPLEIEVVSLPKVGGEYMHPYAPDGAGVGKACWDGHHDVHLSPGQSCQMSFTVESDQVGKIDGNVGIHLKGADKTEIDLPVHTDFIDQAQAHNTLTLLKTPTLVSGQTIDFEVQNMNTTALKNVALDLSNVPNEIYQHLDFSQIPAKQYDANKKIVYFTNPYGESALLAKNAKVSMQIMLKADSESVLKKYYQDILANCKAGMVIKPHGNCQVLYNVGFNAYTQNNTPESKPIVISYQSQADDTKHYTTVGQMSSQQMSISGVNVTFEKNNILIKAGSQQAPEVTNIALKNDGEFNWQLPSDLSAFTIHPTVDGSTSVIGLSVVNPVDGAFSCGSGEKLAPGQICYIGIQSDNDDLDKNTQYVLTVKKENNISSEVSHNFSVFNGAVTAAVDTKVDGDFSVKSLLLSNTDANDRTVTFSLNDVDQGFSVYQGAMTQDWCTPVSCPESCFNSTHPFSVAGNNTITLPAEKSCQIYVKANPLAIGKSSAAIAKVVGLGETGAKQSTYQLSAKGYLFEMDYNRSYLNELSYYDGNKWHELTSSKYIFDLRLNAKGSPVFSYQISKGDLGTENYKLYQGVKKVVSTLPNGHGASGDLFIMTQTDPTTKFVTANSKVYKTTANHDDTGWYIQQDGEYAKDKRIYVPGSYNQYTMTHFNLVSGVDHNLYLLAQMSPVGSYNDYQLFKLVTNDQSYQWQAQGAAIQLENVTIDQFVQGQDGHFYFSSKGDKTGAIYKLTDNRWQQMVSFDDKTIFNNHLYALNVNKEGELYAVAATQVLRGYRYEFNYNLYQYNALAKGFLKIGALTEVDDPSIELPFNIVFGADNQVYTNYYGDRKFYNNTGFAVYNSVDKVLSHTTGHGNAGDQSKIALSTELTIS